MQKQNGNNVKRKIKLNFFNNYVDNVYRCGIIVTVRGNDEFRSSYIVAILPWLLVFLPLARAN